MPISVSAKKSLRKSVKNRKTNVAFKDKVKSVVKKYLLKPSETGLKEAFSVLDKAKKKHIFHGNKVARLKSRLSKKLVAKSAPKVSIPLGSAVSPFDKGDKTKIVEEKVTAKKRPQKR